MIYWLCCLSKLRICGIEYFTEYDVGSLYNIMILIMENIKRKYKYTVVENMKFISNQLNEHPSDHDIWLKYYQLRRSVFAGSHQNPSRQKDDLMCIRCLIIYSTSVFTVTKHSIFGICSIIFPLQVLHPRFAGIVQHCPGWPHTGLQLTPCWTIWFIVVLLSCLSPDIICMVQSYSCMLE